MDLKGLLSPKYGAPQSGFAVDDVTPSAERLTTSELLSVVRRKVPGEVLVGALNARRVVNVHTNCPNPLVAAVHLAFSCHLPLTLSPDAIWLTIVQGFSHHVNENAEALRGRLVRHQGQSELTAQIEHMTVAEVTRAVSGFSRQIRERTDPALHDTLLCDFTTTTPEMRIASEVALMDTYSHYFRYSIEQCICGIPRITLAGAIQDWQRILDRVEVLDTFGLEWWVARLRPILQEFVRAAEGRPDREFWRGIYKFRPAIRPYDSEKVTGWVVDLFPYLGDAPERQRSHVFDSGRDREVAAGAFPSGLCSVPVELKILNAYQQVVDTQELELIAGLLGVEQAERDAALSPTISWFLADRAPALAEQG